MFNIVLSTILTLYFSGLLYAWKLPSKEFLNNFAKAHDVNSITIYLPISFVSCGIIKRYVNPNNDIPFQVLIMPQYKNWDKLSFRNQDLHVFVPYEDYLEETVSDFMNIFNNRSRSRVEQWFLDISNIESPHNILKNLKADIDDDFYLYESGTSTLISISEAYKPQDNLPLKVLNYGSWDDNRRSLNIRNLEKWKRRRDLSGVHFGVNAMTAKPYITEMRPKVNKTEEFEIFGYFAEIFFTLQVKFTARK